jgi:CheY-like chemotaxis protein
MPLLWLAEQKSYLLMTIPTSENCLCSVYKNRGSDTVEAATGVEALDQARTTCPNLIVIDLAMPGGNGDEAIASRKADPLTRDVSVIVLTALRRSPPVDRAMAAGAAEILHRRPVDFKTLQLVLQRHLSVRS